MAQWRKVLVSGSAASVSSVNSDAAITAGTSFIIGSADINETDLEKIDGITDGAGAANKALVLDSNADIASGLRNITITGTFSDGNYTFDTSGNVSGLGTVGSGNITSTGTVQGTTITATTAFVPDASDGAALGTSSLEFSDLFLADEAVINLGNEQDVTLTHVADTGILLNSTRKIQFNDSSQYIGASSAADLDIAATTDVNIEATTLDVNAALDVSGATTLNGAVTLGDASGDDITNTGRWVGDFVPKSDSAIDLGTSALQFAEAHIDSGYIDDITATGTSTLTTVDINGGNIDGTTIGATSAAAGTFAATVATTLKNASAVGASHLTGSFTGSFVGDGSNLTGVSQDIDTLNAYGAATLHQTQDKFLVSDNGTEKSITFSNLQDSIFADVSGDATIAAGGAVTIAANAVEGSMLNDNVISGQSNLGSATVAQEDEFLFSDAGTIKALTFSNLEDSMFGNFSGEATVAAGGAVTLAATNTSLTTLANLTTAGALNAGSITTGFGSINNGASAITTTGTVTAGTLSVTGNSTINGDLTVNGTTTTLSTTNLAVGDSFIFAATGSAASNVDGGLIVQEGASVDSGSAIYHDTGDNRWAVAKSVAASATAVTALEHVVTVKQLGDNDDPVSGDKEYGAGEMAINSDGTIWIFS